MKLNDQLTPLDGSQNNEQLNSKELLDAQDLPLSQLKKSQLSSGEDSTLLVNNTELEATEAESLTPLRDPLPNGSESNLEKKLLLD